MKTTRTLILALIASAAVVIAPAQAMQHPIHNADVGAQVTTAAFDRTIVVVDHSRWVNVTNGETVQFDVDGHRFTYAFNAWNNINSVDLATIVPSGVTAPKVRVYIASNPLNQE